MSGFAELADNCPLLAAIGLAAGRSRFDLCKNLLGPLLAFVTPLIPSISHKIPGF